jgi:YfiH family protein
MISPSLFQSFKIPGFFSFKLPKNEIFNLFPETFFPLQIHSDKIIELKAPTNPLSKEGDAVITQLKGLSIGVQTADCVPILIAHKKQACIASVHAGWRGTLAGILSKTLEGLIKLGYKPEDLLVALGPHIQGSCYEVKNEVIDALDTYLKKPPFLSQREGKYFLNLREINLYQARTSGIPEENLWASSHCTHCLGNIYHSFRREKNHQFTQVALIRL